MVAPSTGEEERMRIVRLLPIALVAIGLAMPAVAQAQEEAAKPPVMSHTADGRDNCMMCHSGKMEGMKAAPENHAGRENDSCLLCHSADSPLQTAEAPMMKHTAEGKDNCMMCHSGKMPNIAAAPHEGVDQQYCGLCHKPQS
jgi:hypothetical protein